MKIHLSTVMLPTVALLFLAAPLGAQQAAVDGKTNPYDLLGRTLQPIAAVFSSITAQGEAAKPQALMATLVLKEMTGLPPELTGARVEIIVQPPDHLLIRGPFGGQTATICRVGQEVWVSPASIVTTAAPLISGSMGSAKPEKKKKKTKAGGLAPMALPFPPQELAFLPLLFVVKDAGEANGARLLDVQLMPELGRHLGVKEWAARLYINPVGQPSAQLAGIELARPGWHLLARVERLSYSAELPPMTWEPGAPPNPALSDTAHLTAKQLQEWLEMITRQVNLPTNPRPLQGIP